MDKSVLAKLPAVNTLLEKTKVFSDLIDHIYLKKIIEQRLSVIRENPVHYKLNERSKQEIESIILTDVQKEISGYLSPNIFRVINATGVILHTGLGRAPYGKEMIGNLTSLSQYVNLEIDLRTGQRGERLDLVVPLLKLLTGAENGAVVNNNAAAVLLVLNSIARNKEVIISRGEQVEIGGSFRMPEVMKSSSAKMVEIGATNKTHLRDYEEAITDKTAAIMLVHPSNFEIKGFAAKPDPVEIVELAHQRNIPVIYDVGSGALINLEAYGFYREPVIAEQIQMDIDLITFSGDKLLGGPQSGIIVGKNHLIKKIRKNHLLRALRCDKLTLALLSLTLQKYLHPQSLSQTNETYEYFARSLSDMEKLGKEISEKLDTNFKKCISLVDSQGKIGSGAYPTFPIKTKALALKFKSISAQKIARVFRNRNIPIVGYISDDMFHISMLTIHKDDKSEIIKAIQSLK